MPPRKNKSLRDQEVTIPVRVVAGREAPARHSPAVITPPRIVKKNRPAQPPPAALPEPKAIPKQTSRGIHAWPEERRRRVMWISVLGLMVIISVGWIATWKYEVGPSGEENFFRQFSQAFKNFRITSPKTAAPVNKEVQALENQVFPQFTTK